MIAVDDPADERLADYRALRDPERRMREGADGGFLIVEGMSSIKTLLHSGRTIRSLLFTSVEHARIGAALAGVAAPVYVTTRPVLHALTGFDVHRGALASAQRWTLPEASGLLADARRIVLCEAITDNTNLGTVFRSAAAFGYDAVLLDDPTVDPLARRSVRVSAGHTLTVPFARLAAITAAIASARAAGFQVAALTPSPDAVDLRALVPGDRLALLLGTEGAGLSRAAIDAADVRVRIPLAAGVDSLNVAAAASIAMWALGARG
jgi:tRNA G18 (ribose-2'-O)-methylase SpoU